MSDNLRHAVAYEKLLSEKEDLERRLAEAEKDCNIIKGQLQKTQQQLKESTQVSIKLALQKGGQVDEMRDLRARLRAASELIEKWRERNLHHCYYCADELEAALREAEG